MVSFPPQPVSLPAFPPLPEAVHAPPKVADASARQVRSSAPSLIIVGTTITNHVPPPAPKPPVPKPALTNPPPMVITSTPAPAVANEVKPPAVVPLVQTSAVPAQSPIAAAPLATTKAAIAPRLKVPGSAVKMFWPLAWHFWRAVWWFSCSAAPADPAAANP
jgi:hypothetical protein